MKDITRIAITGGPCGGKSTLLSRAKSFLDSRGYITIVQPEAATELIGAGFPPSPEVWRYPLAFQEHLLDLSLAREGVYESMINQLAADLPVVWLDDRGLCDLAAYVGKPAFQELLRRKGLSIGKVMRRYRQVIHMVSAADGAEEYYTLENNLARSESPERARELDKLTQAAWWGHPHHAIVKNKGTFEMKVFAALDSMRRVLGIPRLLMPLERERVFLFKNFSYELIPADAVRRDIVQTYLVEHIDGHERRVRKDVCHKSESYTYTQKVGSKTLGVRDEQEKLVSVREYEDLLCSRDLSREHIVKTRYCFSWGNRSFELDDFHMPVSIQTVEVEGVGMREHIDFPPGWDVVEVTSDPRYSNSAIAAGSLRDRAA